MLTFALALAAASVLVVSPAQSADKLPQTLHFTTDAPTDAVVFNRYGAVVLADSSSGLPVTISADPNTPACVADSGPVFIYGNVTLLHGGPCTIYADQPGDDQYAPAERISMTFQVVREETGLTAAKASKGLLGLNPTTFRATLERNAWFGPGYGTQPFVGEPVTFSVGGKKMCTATTVAVADGTFFGSAVATCKKAIGVAAALKYKTYTASYAGSQDYKPVTATGVLK
jgi:hypothetical protein